MPMIGKAPWPRASASTTRASSTCSAIGTMPSAMPDTTTQKVWLRSATSIASARL